MKHFSEVLAQQLKKHKISHEAYASLILEKMKQIISSHLGDEIDGNIIPYKYNDRKIYITAKNAAWKQAIYPYKTVFCRLIQKEFSLEEITEIVIL